MSALHGAFGWFVVFANAIVGVWALASIRFPQLESRALWVAVAIAQGSVLVQGAMGLYLQAVEGREASEGLHPIYGVIAIGVILVGYMYALGSPWVRERRNLFYGVVSLFLMGLAIHAMLLG